MDLAAYIFGKFRFTISLSRWARDCRMVVCIDSIFRDVRSIRNDKISGHPISGMVSGARSKLLGGLNGANCCLETGFMVLVKVDEGIPDNSSRVEQSSPKGHFMVAGA
ncbi:hypothetical protein AG1IA_08944 [Rhizoctonia solani AG-1 IA]|uniref:Uncharacterized protein n=1 Tax=Thanatephorus cucumeris (strain AG1-IA) TaxID=983506 RepID=L8WKY1_THACA|nr:hypothetical protein AG1IA_08944 [Rhizoctonia solani AG-1 IA]